MKISAKTQKEVSRKMRAIIKACEQAHRATAKSKLVFKLAIMILAIGLTGCTSTYVDYKTSNGGNLSLHRRSMLTKVDMPSVKFNPDGSVEMVGYKNDQAAAVSDAVKAACKGAVEGAIGK